MTSSSSEAPAPPAQTDVRAWWKKFLADLSSTRIQLTYLVSGLFSAVVIKGLLLVTSVADAVALGAMLTTPFIAVLTYHMAGKYIEVTAPTNGNGGPKK